MDFSSLCTGFKRASVLVSNSSHYELCVQNLELRANLIDLDSVHFHGHGLVAVAAVSAPEEHFRLGENFSGSEKEQFITLFNYFPNYFMLDIRPGSV